MGNSPTKWYVTMSKTGPARLSLRPVGAPEASLGARPRLRPIYSGRGLRLRPASANQPRPAWAAFMLASHLVLGLRPRYVKLMRRMQIKAMTFKERRKLWMFNGKKNKLTKESARWK